MSQSIYMKKVTRYQADDGTEFETEEQCLSYEHKQTVIDKMDRDLYLRELDSGELYDWIVNNIELFNHITTS